ncbi:hypothetical protein VL14_08440 [Cytobacillus firmus]|nr:hypothetical protein VL14_08440 [Cytobacillus firmus]
MPVDVGVLISAAGTQQTRGAGGEPPRRFASAGSHLSRYSRRTLNKHPRIITARRKCGSIFEDLAPSAPINTQKYHISVFTAYKKTKSTQKQFL